MKPEQDNDMIDPADVDWGFVKLLAACIVVITIAVAVVW